MDNLLGTEKRTFLSSKNSHLAIVFSALCAVGLVLAGWTYPAESEVAPESFANDIMLVSVESPTLADVDAVSEDSDIVHGVLDKSRFQSFMTMNQGATALIFDTTVPFNGASSVDISEEQNGSILAFMEGGTMHVIATSGGKVKLPDDCSDMFMTMQWTDYLPNTKTIDMSNCDTSNVTDMRGMFRESENLTSLNLSGWDTSRVEDMGYMFEYCSSLQKITVGDGWDTSNVTNAPTMFGLCGVDFVTLVNKG